MFEYIFFDATLRDRCIAHIVNMGVSCIMGDCNMGTVVTVPGGLAE